MKWWQKTIAYEIYPRSFYDTQGKGTGTLQGIIEKLPYLQSLHIGALWITPVFRSPMIDNGYDVADYTDIDPMFGEMKDMDQLIQEGKKYDIRIVLDLVFNHTSDQCPWFLESKKDRTNQYSDWYIWKDPKPDGSAPTNWRSIFGGSAWTYCKERNQYYLHTFAVQQPDLNWADAQVRKALADVANFWLDKGAGGFRMDAVTYIKKPEVFADGPVDANDGMSAIHPLTANQPGILDYLHEFKDRTVKGKDVFTVGEANGVETDELPQWVGKDGVFDMIFSFDHVHVPLGKAEEWCYAPEWKLSELKQALNNIEKSTGEGWCPVFFENHDSPRSVNNFFTCEGSYADKAKALGTVLLTMRGTPFMYQGEEIGMHNTAWDIHEYNDVSSYAQYQFALKEGFNEEEALAAVHRFSRDNARTPMQWNSEVNAGFTSGKPWLKVSEDYQKINVEAEETDNGSVLSWYRKLASIRQQHEELISGSYEEIMAEDEQIFAYYRKDKTHTALVLVNLSSQPADFDPALTQGFSVLVQCQKNQTGKLAPFGVLLLEKTNR